jgi:hypothetical protein
MNAYDVFNGDADGLCALQQLRLDAPRDATLVTGPKRDIALLGRVTAQPGDAITVLDVSLARNRDGLLRALHAGARVQWFDHHHAGDVPAHPGLEAHIDESPETCTSLIVDRHLGGRHRAWAVVGAYGDNLGAEAARLVGSLGLAAAALDALRELGESLNYNAYGDSTADLLAAPDALHRRMRAFADPLAFAASDPCIDELHARRHADLALAMALAPEFESATVAVYRLPATPWARRIGGTFAHHLARLHPQRAHGVLGPNADGSFWASIRAPLARPRGAAALARQFSTGGGREGAAGIERLAPEAIGAFVAALAAAFADATPAAPR